MNPCTPLIGPGRDQERHAAAREIVLGPPILIIVQPLSPSEDPADVGIVEPGYFDNQVRQGGAIEIRIEMPVGSVDEGTQCGWGREGRTGVETEKRLRQGVIRSVH